MQTEFEPFNNVLRAIAIYAVETITLQYCFSFMAHTMIDNAKEEIEYLSETIFDNSIPTQ